MATLEQECIELAAKFKQLLPSDDFILTTRDNNIMNRRFLAVKNFNDGIRDFKQGKFDSAKSNFMKAVEDEKELWRLAKENEVLPKEERGTLSYVRGPVVDVPEKPKNLLDNIEDWWNDRRIRRGVKDAVGAQEQTKKDMLKEAERAQKEWKKQFSKLKQVRGEQVEYLPERTPKKEGFQPSLTERQQLALPAPKKMLALPPPSSNRVIPMGANAGVNTLPSSGVPIRTWPPEAQYSKTFHPSNDEAIELARKYFSRMPPDQREAMIEGIANAVGKGDTTYGIYTNRYGIDEGDKEKIGAAVSLAKELGIEMGEWVFQEGADTAITPMRKIERRRESAPRTSPEEEERLIRAGLKSPSTPIAKAREPPAPSESRREEKEPEKGDDNWGTIAGTVKDNKGNELEDVAYVQVDSPFISRAITVPTDDKSTYEITVPTRRGGLQYSVTVTAENYKKARPKRVNVSPGVTTPADFQLDPDEEAFKKKHEAEKEKREGEREKKSFWGKRDKEAKEGRGFPLLSPRWWSGMKTKDPQTGEEYTQYNWPRVLIALGLTLFFFFALYRPTFSALGQDLGWANWMIPIIFGVLMFYTVPSFGRKTDMGPFLIACVYGIGSWVGLTFFTRGVGHASFIQWGVPLAMYLIGYNLTKRKKIAGGVIAMLPIIFVGGIITLTYNLVSSGDAFQLETYLKTFDVLRLVGVSQHSIDNMKDGVRSALSYLNFKAVEPGKPEAKKIGGFEAIQVKFGTQSNNYQLPTLYARSEYTLPITVTNPNKLETSAVVKDFRIQDAVMNNGTANRFLCGGKESCPAGYLPKIVDGSASCCIDKNCIPAEKFVEKLGDIKPEEQTVLTIEFKGKSQNDFKSGDKVDCRFILNSPLAPAYFTVPFEDKKAGSKVQDCLQVCVEGGAYVVKSHNDLYGSDDTIDPSYSTYYPDSLECGCKMKQYANVLDNMCNIENNMANIQLRSIYDFNVEGKGELILLKSPSDNKIAPKPSITSSSGPLTVTTYFVPSINSFDGKLQAKNVFIDIKNDGDGAATISDLTINSKSLQNLPISLDDKGKIKITKCSPSPDVFQKLQIDKDTTTIICTLDINQDAFPIEGSYNTIPAIVDIKYSYSEVHSTSTPIRKVFIPPEVTDRDKIQELENTYRTLPYYCPSDLATYCSYSYSQISFSQVPAVKGSQVKAFSDFNFACNNRNLQLKLDSCESTTSLGQCTIKDGTCTVDSFKAPDKEGTYQFVLCDNTHTTYHFSTLTVS